jgi:small subunit ribosomal protein S8
MSMNDPLGDMLTRIRNGQQARKAVTACPWSKLHESVCKVLTDEGYIRGYKVEDIGNNKKEMHIELKYARSSCLHADQRLAAILQWSWH